jgi:flavin prenyltransferase
MDKLRDGRKSSPQRIVVGIDGATGIIYGLRALQILREIGIETHLVVSHAGDMIREDETPLSRGDLYALADVVHPETDVGASIASDVYQALGMLIAPCSVRTVGELASGVPLTLLARAADVALKERRLVMMVREAPLHRDHIRDMLAVTESGAIIHPPVPAFYTKPRCIGDIVDHTVAQALRCFGLNVRSKARSGWTLTELPDDEAEQVSAESRTAISGTHNPEPTQVEK